MRRLILLSLLCAVPTLGRAQAQVDVDKHFDLLRADIRAQKVQIITQAMAFSVEEAAAFWPVYEKYQVEAKIVGDQRVALIKDYAANYDTMDDLKAKEMIERSFAIDEQRIALLKKYVPDFMKVLTAKRTARFLQVETQLNRMIDIQIASEIPLVK